MLSSNSSLKCGAEYLSHDDPEDIVVFAEPINEIPNEIVINIPSPTPLQYQATPLPAIPYPTTKSPPYHYSKASFAVIPQPDQIRDVKKNTSDDNTTVIIAATVSSLSFIAIVVLIIVCLIKNGCIGRCLGKVADILENEEEEEESIEEDVKKTTKKVKSDNYGEDIDKSTISKLFKKNGESLDTEINSNLEAIKIHIASPPS